MTRELDLTADYIDVRDIIARVEELRDERDAYDNDVAEAHQVETECSDEDAVSYAASRVGAPEDEMTEERTELATLETILDDLKGNGGAEQWEGAWYPVTLIRDSYFNQSMDELLEDIGDIPKDIPGYLKIVVDYDALQMDYTSTEIEGETYWYR